MWIVSVIKIYQDLKESFVELQESTYLLTHRQYVA